MMLFRRGVAGRSIAAAATPIGIRSCPDDLWSLNLAVAGFVPSSTMTQRRRQAGTSRSSRFTSIPAQQGGIAPSSSGTALGASARSIAPNLKRVLQVLTGEAAEGAPATVADRDAAKAALGTIPITMNSLDVVSFGLLLRLALVWPEPDRLAVIASFAQNYMQLVPLDSLALLCRLIAENPAAVPKTTVLVGMMSHRFKSAVAKLPTEQLPWVFAVFVAAGPLGDAVVADAAAGLEAWLRGALPAGETAGHVSPSCASSSAPAPLTLGTATPGLQVATLLLQNGPARLERLVEPVTTFLLAALASIDSTDFAVAVLPLLLRGPLFLTQPNVTSLVLDALRGKRLRDVLGTPVAKEEKEGFAQCIESMLQAVVVGAGALGPVAGKELMDATIDLCADAVIAAASHGLSENAAATIAVAFGSVTSLDAGEPEECRKAAHRLLRQALLPAVEGKAPETKKPLVEEHWVAFGERLRGLAALGAAEDIAVVQTEVERAAKALSAASRKGTVVSNTVIAALINRAVAVPSTSGISRSPPSDTPGSGSSRDEPLPSPAWAAIATLLEEWSGGWALAEWVSVVEATAQIPSSSSPCTAVRETLRPYAAAIAPLLAHASPHQVAIVASGCAQHHIRTLTLSTAIAERLSATRETASPTDVSQVLVALTKLDARLPKPFLDCVPQLRQATATLSAGDACALLLAYARHNVWLYKVYARLADRAVEVAADWTLLDMKRALAGLHRVDVLHDGFTSQCQLRILRDFDEIPLAELIALVSATTKARAWSPDLLDRLATRVVDEQQQLTVDQLGQALMCPARVGMLQPKLFDSVALRLIALAPTSSPLAIADVLTAFASQRNRRSELFAVFGERALALKGECPAVTIAAVLTAFSAVGIKDDKLFIEMIPRVRFVAHHGAPQDVANVLTAYTSVGLWHYKLFVKLAERAIQLRAECSAEQLAQILFAFSKVEMKYDKLFVELSPRVQVIAATAKPSPLAMLAHSYAALKVYDKGVMNAIAERSISMMAQFEREEATLLVRAYASLANKDSRLVEAVKARFNGDDLLTDAAAPSQTTVPRDSQQTDPTPEEGESNPAATADLPCDTTVGSAPPSRE